MICRGLCACTDSLWMCTLYVRFGSKVLFLLRAVLNLLVRNASTRGPMCFRWLIFSLSGPCELLFLLCFIASWT